MFEIKIGETLNSSILDVGVAMRAGDRDTILHLIEAQTEAGADYLDINTALCGAPEAELEKMVWIIELAEQYSDCGLMLDSPSAAILSEAVKHVRHRDVIFNSVTLTTGIDALIPVAVKFGAGIVGLPIDSMGIPKTAEARIHNAALLIDRFRSGGIPPEKIYIDALVENIATNTESALVAFETLRLFSVAYPTIKSLCGISGLSYGLPNRPLLNAAFLAIAMSCGLNSAILDVTSPEMQSTLQAAITLCNQDEFCAGYIAMMREKKEEWGIE